MNKRLSGLLFFSIAVFSVFLFSLSASATIIGGSSGVPDFESDDGTILFSPDSSILSVELFDPFSAFGTNTSFGFYFAGADLSDSSNFITLFDSADQAVPPSDEPQIAYVDFETGIVLDIDDDPTSIQNSFTPQGPNADIGFFLTFNSFIFFTDPNLNPLGLDLAGTFPSSTTLSQYLIGFEVITNQSDPGTVLYLNVVQGINPVPEPATLWLLATGLIGLCSLVRKRQA